MSFDALYGGYCCRCGEFFKIGTSIERDPDRLDWRHAPDCPELEPDKPTKFQGTTLEDMGF